MGFWFGVLWFKDWHRQSIQLGMGSGRRCMMDWFPLGQDVRLAQAECWTLLYSSSFLVSSVEQSTFDVFGITVLSRCHVLTIYLLFKDTVASRLETCQTRDGLSLRQHPRASAAIALSRTSVGGECGKRRQLLTNNVRLSTLYYLHFYCRERLPIPTTLIMSGLVH